MVSAIRYLAGEKSVDRELLNILEEYALRDPDPEEEIWIRKVDGGKEFYGGDPLHHGINSVRGSAVEALVLIGQTEELSKDVIRILHRLSEKDPVSVRCCAINHLAVLIRYDRKGIEKIFHNLTKDLHPQVVKYGLNCLSYLMDHNFSLYKKHLTVTMNLIEKFGYDSVQQNVGQILTLAYAIGLRGSKELLEKICRISNDAKAGSVDFAIRHLVHQKRTVRSKAQQIYKRFINNKTEVVQSEYSKGFTQLEVRDFDSLFPLVLLYSKKKHIKEHSFDYLVEYLQKLVHSYPEKIVLILRNYFEKTIMNSNNLGYSDEPIQILIGAYDRLNKRNANVKELDNVMNLFDRMLTIPAMRYQAIGVLTKMDYL